jgi:tetratricopeptide (TPR) repeat protein
LGRVYDVQNRLEEAITAYRQAQLLAQRQNQQLLEVFAWERLGLALLRRASLETGQRQVYLAEAAQAFEQALALSSALETEPLLLARLYYYLGHCYHQLGRWQEAMEQLIAARQVFTEHKARPELARTLLELGQLHHEYLEFEDAYTHLKDAFRLFQRLEYRPGLAATQEALGNLLLQAGRLAEATDLLQAARQNYLNLQHEKRAQEVDELLEIAAEAKRELALPGMMR